MATQQHQAGQDRGRSGEADERLEEHRHGATPNEQALNKGRTAAGAKAKVDARLLPALCFEMIAPARFDCFRTGLGECRPTTMAFGVRSGRDRLRRAYSQSSPRLGTRPHHYYFG